MPRTKGALNTWSSWEKRIKMELEMQGHSVSRIPEVVVQIHRVPIRKKADVDFVFSIKGKPVWADAKVTEDNLWNLKEYVFNPKKIHQWNKLLKVDRNGDGAGYLLWFIKHQKIVWCPIRAIELAVEEGRFSIHPESPMVYSQDESKPIAFEEMFSGSRSQA